MKRILALLCCVAVVFSVLTGCTSPEPAVQEDENTKIALIAMDQMEPSLEAGALRAASELNIEAISMAAEGMDTVQQISNAVSSGCQVLVAVVDGSEAVWTALAQAADTGVRIVCVNTSAATAVDGAITTDYEASGRAAGEELLAVLKARRISSGVVGIIGTDTQEDRQRIAGFRSAFEGEVYTLVETLQEEADISKFRFAAGNYITYGASGLFGSCEAAAIGIGNAAKTAQSQVAVVGLGQPEGVGELVDAGYIQAAIVYDYETMGYDAVKAAAAALAGELTDDTHIDAVFTVLKTEPKDVDTILAAAINDFRIALIGKDRFDRYWAYLEEGALMAAEELGCEVVNLSPDFRDEEEQAEQIYDAIDQSVDAIVIAAEDSDEVTDALQEAAAAGIRIVCVDSAADMAVEAVYATDHQAAGRTAAETMIAGLEDQGITEGTIGVIGAGEEDEEALQREKGFRSAFEETAYTLLESRYGEGDAAMSYEIAREYIEEDVQGIFCCSEGALNGAGNAVEEHGAQVVVVGFGETDRIQELIDEGVILAAVTHYPGAMGYEAVRAACAVLHGGVLNGQFFDTGVYILKKQ